MKRYVEITDEAQLQENWTDEAIPNMSFSFEQSTIDQCVEINNKIYATYTPMILPNDWPISYHHPIKGNVSLTIPAGTYGIHPNTVELS